ncbi:PREDICTED: protein FAM195A [Galeopterus variegatus]|uniref:Protein FAM195A n=1 Tax=Galeopterus variegatus TaxID=482537 RepID=A0ABM0R9W9_GALVR|nr:PREDICTED: protein FAM195A [Galeopterus variegatus]
MHPPAAGPPAPVLRLLTACWRAPGRRLWVGVEHEYGGNAGGQDEGAGTQSGGGAPEPRKASRPAGTASAWRSGRRSPGLPAPTSCCSPGPRLVFNRVNGRRPSTMSPSLEGTQETYTLAHEENVRFVSEAWQQVEQQLDGGPASESGPRPVQYMERTPNPRLQNFVPIDLDEWWAQQFLARITNCS